MNDNIVRRVLTDYFMRFSFLLRDSLGLTLVFFALVVLAVFTQLTKKTLLKKLPVLPRALIKAAPALFLSALSWYLGQPLGPASQPKRLHGLLQAGFAQSVRRADEAGDC